MLKVHKYLDRPEGYCPAISLPRQTRMILAPVFLRTLFQLKVSTEQLTTATWNLILFCETPLTVLFITDNPLYASSSLSSRREFARKDIVLALPETMVLTDIWTRLGDEAVCLWNWFKLFQFKNSSLINSLINLTTSAVRSTHYFWLKPVRVLIGKGWELRNSCIMLTAFW